LLASILKEQHPQRRFEAEKRKKLTAAVGLESTFRIRTRAPAARHFLFFLSLFHANATKQTMIKMTMNNRKIIQSLRLIASLMILVFCIHDSRDHSHHKRNDHEQREDKEYARNDIDHSGAT
jgi:hypothetical protein